MCAAPSTWRARICVKLPRRLNAAYNGLMAAQVAFYLLAAGGNWLPARPRCLRYLRLPTMFVSMNAALFLGFFRWLLGRQGGTWKRTDRTPDGANPQPEVQPVGVGPHARQLDERRRPPTTEGAETARDADTR